MRERKCTTTKRDITARAAGGTGCTPPDHKVIGIIYLWHALVAFALGGLLALVFRTELAINPDNVMLSLSGYNAAVSIHGLTMIFW